MKSVLLTDYAWPDLNIERAILAEVATELIVAPDPSIATLCKLSRDVDAILACWAKVPAEVIYATTCCRIIARLGIGLDNIDVAAATARGILVTNVPDYCLHEVAEHTLALLLALGRRVAFFHLQTKSGRYDLTASPQVARIHGQTLGVVGLGQIGRAFAVQAQGIGMRVVATSRSRREPMTGVAWRSLDELLEESDYVSLHLPLLSETRHLIGRDQLARMKSTAYLINTSRGGLINHADLADALAAGRLAGAALDVQDPEPPDLSLPPYNDPRVIVTPHAAFASRESLLELRTRATQQIADCLAGRRPVNVVNL